MKNTLHDHVKKFYAVAALDSVMSRSTLIGLRRIIFFLFAIAVASLAGIQFTALSLYSEIVLGIAILLFGNWIAFTLLYFYHNTYYFFGLDSIIGAAGKQQSGCTYDVARTICIDENDITGAFLGSVIGNEIFARLDISKTDISAFLGSVRTKCSSRDFVTDERTLITLINVAHILYQTDHALREFLTHHGVTAEQFSNVVTFCVTTLHKRKRVERWWSRDQLSKTTGIGGELAYGVAYDLQHFSRSLYTSTVYSELGITSANIIPYCERIEHTLARDKAANILLIGNPGVGKMDIVIGVAKRLRTGGTLHALHHAQFILLDTERLIATYGDKNSFEQRFLSLLDQAALAGNCVIVIENISSFISHGTSIGVSVYELLDTYLALPSLHIIAIDTPAGYHTFLRPLGSFVRRFEEILVEESSLDATRNVIESLALVEEQRHGVFFTYSAITAIVTAADRYITEGVMPDKAITLLIDSVGYASQHGISTITDATIYTYISTITGIPTGPVTDTERDTLLNLESVLGARVVAQGAAVAAVAKTMRRARANIERTDKPIGSFLFLGPTGVGKTETAKALAHVFFQNESNMVRLDMSEFSGPDAVSRLIGTHEQSGLLSDRLREHPYTVLLLDEFEKAHITAHDIFLQILDEGYCTDGRGENVNARNTIIIATSNAGSDLIIRTQDQRSASPVLDQEIVSHIIAKKLLRPELINRFDATIVFSPLGEAAKYTIAGQFLSALETRIQTEGYNLTINRDVIPLLITTGFDTQFGARPLGRAIQDIIEDKISKLIIAGTIKKGDTVHLSHKDFASA